MKVKEILAFLDKKFPVNTARDFDNVGLLIGNGEEVVKKAVVALDCTLETVKFACQNGCNLIITHHPVIFSPLKKILAGDVAYEVVKNGLSVISMHTNLDVAEGGVNDSLSHAIGLSNITFVTADDGYTLQSGEVPSLTVDSFAKQIKSALGGTVKFVDAGRKINRVLVCSGSGGDYLDFAIRLGIDALVTADVKHHLFLSAYDNKVSLFDAGHFNTEDVVVEPLKELLCNNFSDTEFITFHKTNIQYK